ncbi:hypothetical protein [Picrophilus oshimae]|uniref:Uncharacterized protein n=1 Tax=Picrophilus torridus (strain ATCC 700027 / DSM 9790 / JCM 10055 / NBRC 100828 / KAW 2/3) TaxID=1122961 RepID=A0A8G2L7B9_PICTO|nr:hypothetical protein [Picrophilus oshimae]SMD30957.1 hypothetical protein SAMN02745355_0875 [Picrophilus oshimae DSM 9789]
MDIDPESFKQYIAFKYDNGKSSFYFLKTFYDIYINDDILYSVNVLEFRDDHINIYRTKKAVYSIPSKSIYRFDIYYRYHEISLKLLRLSFYIIVISSLYRIFMYLY